MSFIEDNPFDIGEKNPAVDDEDGQNDGKGEEEAAEEIMEVQTDHPEEESAQEPKDEEEENIGVDKDNDPVETNEEEVDEEGKEAANGDLRIPVDQEEKPKVRNSQMSTDVYTVLMLYDVINLYCVLWIDAGGS